MSVLDEVFIEDLDTEEVHIDDTQGVFSVGLSPSYYRADSFLDTETTPAEITTITVDGIKRPVLSFDHLSDETAIVEIITHEDINDQDLDLNLHFTTITEGGNTETVGNAMRFLIDAAVVGSGDSLTISTWGTAKTLDYEYAADGQKDIVNLTSVTPANLTGGNIPANTSVFLRIRSDIANSDANVVQRHLLGVDVGYTTNGIKKSTF